MRAYAAKHKDSSIVNHSRSGGIFIALAESVLSRSGAVYGCILDRAFVAVHSRAVSINELKAMRGSKYVQSALGNTFRMVREDVVAGRPVLFSGTSCQIDGLRSFLQKDYENLLCVDIACYGVPSPKLWQKYLEWQSKGKPIIAVDFRNKQKYGWRGSVETVMIEDQEIDSRVWSSIFYSRNALRPCCYECHYKSIHHPGDITLADFGE